MPPDRSLRRLVGADVWRRLAALHGEHFTPAELERLEPWFVTLWTLPQVLDARPMPGVRRGAPSLDAAIAARAAARGVAVSSLESPVEHLTAFSAMGRTEAVAMLAEIVTDPTAMRDETDRLVAAYARGDDRVVRKVVGRLVRRRPVLAEYLLWRRNARWLDKLALWLPDGGILVAVGAGHLYGERGLVALLRARGYRVEAVRSPARDVASPVPPPRA